MDPIPFNRANYEGQEQTYLAEAIASGHLAGDGRFTKQCHTLLASELGVAKALLTTSCPHALEMTALVLDIQPGDAVIVPAYTLVPMECEQPYHLFYLLLPSLEQRQRLIAHLKSCGIASAFHYLPLNTSKQGQRVGGRPGQCPAAESVSDRLLRLPFDNSLDTGDLGRVVSAVQNFRV